MTVKGCAGRRGPEEKGGGVGKLGVSVHGRHREARCHDQGFALSTQDHVHGPTGLGTRTAEPPRSGRPLTTCHCQGLETPSGSMVEVYTAPCIYGHGLETPSDSMVEVYNMEYMEAYM